MATYGEPIAQGSALGGGGMANRSSQGTAGDVVGLDGVDGALSAEALVQAQREPSGCHGRGDGLETAVEVVDGVRVKLSSFFYTGAARKP